LIEPATVVVVKQRLAYNHWSTI